MTNAMRPTVGQQYVRGFAPDALNRDVDDFYPTPAPMTQALLSVEKFEGEIWEPACGDGAISRELEVAGYKVTSTDLIDRKFGISGRDFLLDHRTRLPNRHQSTVQADGAVY